MCCEKGLENRRPSSQIAEEFPAETQRHQGVGTDRELQSHKQTSTLQLCGMYNKFNALFIFILTSLINPISDFCNKSRKSSFKVMLK